MCAEASSFYPQLPAHPHSLLYRELGDLIFTPIDKVMRASAAADASIDVVIVDSHNVEGRLYRKNQLRTKHIRDALTFHLGKLELESNL
jgi:hypothetical protein